jgi:hypothetical protein
VKPIRAIDRVRGPTPSWIDRRRREIDDQLTALEESRLDDLVDLIGDPRERHDERPGDLSMGEGEREELVQQAETLVRRLAQARREVMSELEAIERERAATPLPRQRRSARGGSIDGYL